MDKTIKSSAKLCKHCFDVLIAELKKEKQPPFPSSVPAFESPLFVTWMINGDDLRGCIGTFSSGPIKTLLPKYALTSALKDSRFPPIALKEVEKLSCSVSLLVDFEDGKDAYDWEVGKHGIIIEFYDANNREYGATFLPEVAKEQGWDKDQTLKYLISKAGWKGDWKAVTGSLSLKRYQSSKCVIDYKTYLSMSE